MKRNNRKSSGIAGPEEHFAALDQLLAQLRTHLTASAEKKGTYGDYLRLLEFYRDTRVQTSEIIVSWVGNETLATEPLP